MTTRTKMKKNNNKNESKKKNKKRLSKEARDREEALAAAKFVTGLLVRSEAVRTVDGQLPSGATHEIVHRNPSESGATVFRRRFSAA